MAVLALEAWFRGERRYARIGPGTARPAPRMSLGAAWPLWTLAPLATAALSVALPATVLARWLALGGAGGLGPPRARLDLRADGELRGRRRGARLPRRAAGRLDVGAGAGAAAARARGLPRLCRVAARRRRRAGAGGGHRARGAAALPVGRDAAGRLRAALPRPRDHRAPREPRAGAGRARGGGGRARPAAAASPRSERRCASPRRASPPAWRWWRWGSPPSSPPR